MDTKSKIYIAGHTGMVGSAIVRRLREKGYGNIITCTMAELDLTNQTATAAFFDKEKPEAVILAAARVGGIMANNTYRAQFIYDNIQIQNNVIHQSYLHGVKDMLFLGSSCIYPKLCPQPIKEEYLLTGELEYTNEPYAIAKIAGLKMCESYNKQYGTHYISVMPTNLYGPNDNYDLEKSHVLPALIRKMHLGKCLEEGNWEGLQKDFSNRPVNGMDASASKEEIMAVLAKFGIERNDNHSAVSITLWGSGTPFREFMHVDDLASACVFLLEQADSGGTFAQPSGSNTERYPHINLGTGKDQTIRELAVIVKKSVGFNGEILWDASKPDGTPRKLLDVSKMLATGFKPAISLEEGIRKTYLDYLNG